jgi:hypothetical protein
MARKKRNPRQDADEVPAEGEYQQTDDRKAELLDTEPDVEDVCLELLQDVTKGFTEQWDRSNQALDNWDIFYSVLGPKQFYTGNSKIFVPLVHDAIEARKTRFVNQMFPTSGKHVEVISSEDKPQGIQSLLEFYIRKARLRTQIFPSLIRNGDIEGQYSLMVHWTKTKRHVTWRVKKKDKIPGSDVEAPGGEEFDDVESDTLVHEYPTVEIIADTDILILPATANTIEEALDVGGSVTVIRRWSKTKINQMIEDEEITEERGEALIASMGGKSTTQTPNKKSAMVEASGARAGDSSKTALVYETWTKFSLKTPEDEEDEGEYQRRIVRIFYAAGAEDTAVSCKRNPYWCDKVPILSAAETKVDGSFKGKAKVTYCESMQYAANDAINEGMDSAAYALLPIIMTDPVKNPRTGTMVLNVAAIWETDPKSTQFAQFPQLWKEAFAIVGSSKDQIFQTLGINPAMMPQQTTAPGKKPNQAAIANEQMVDILTTADAVTNIEDEIASPLLQWFVYLDHQFRSKEITVRAFGPVGLRANMETIEPIQMGRRFEFRWFGVEAARNAQQMQMQMAGINVIKGIPPQMYPGYELNLAPVITQFVENLFGPRLSGEIFQDLRKKLTLEPQFENMLLEAGYDLPVQPMDNDQEHMKAHMELAQQTGDPSGVIRVHMIKHQMNMQKKMQAQQMQQQQILQGGPQQQGGPRQGGRSTVPRGGQKPPGAVPQDQLQGPQGPRVRAA